MIRKNKAALFLSFLGISLIFISCGKEVSKSPVEPPVGEATIVVNSYPNNFTIFLNGKSTGKQTPDSITFLEDGNYKVTLKKKYFKDTTLTIQLNEDERKFISFDIISNLSFRGSLALLSNPEGAQIFINDSLITQVTPDTLTSFLPGEYQIRFKKFNHRDIEFTAQVFSNQLRIFTRNLKDTSLWLDYRNSNSGIQSDFLSSITVDNQNVKWIGTINSGLIRFNEVEFINYNTSNSSIPSNVINCISTDSQGKIWVGTDMGLAVYDGVSWVIYNQRNSGLVTDIINSIKFDVAGIAWIATSSGLYKFDGTNWKRFYLTNDIFWVEDFALGADGKIWIGTSYKGIYILENEVLTELDKIDNMYLTYALSALGSDINNNIWFCFQPDTSGTGGISFWNGTSFNDYLASSNEIFYNNIFIDAFNVKWISSNAGLVSFNNENIYKILNQGNSLLTNNKVTGAVTDLNQVVWIVTNGGGLNKYKPNQ